MRSYRNPFRSRASEHIGEAIVFLRNFGPGMLELIPESIWDRPFLLRSAPGGGKTSLMRLFTIESLTLVHHRRDEFSDLAEELERVGALTEDGPTHLGVLLNLDRDYRSLLDLQLPDEHLIRLFFRLLDARILLAVMRAALAVGGTQDPRDLSLVPLGEPSEAQGAAEPLGGLNGYELWERARQSERAVLAPLDALLPDSLNFEDDLVPPNLHSLRLLSLTRLCVRGRELPERPLVMLDDGHELAPPQRAALLTQLAPRTLQVARWYSERFEALSSEELLVGSIEGRDFERLQLEAQARETRGRVERVLRDVSNRRARPYLQDYADVQQGFSDLIHVSDDELLGGRDDEILQALQQRLGELAAGRRRYSVWTQEVQGASGYEGAVLLRGLEIVMRADLERPQGELFETALPWDEFERRQSRVGSAARHFLARDFELPYYVGPRRFAQLGSENIEQFLRLAGDLFEVMLGEITLRREPRLAAFQQERIARRASERYWRELSQRVHNGNLVRRLAESILALAQADTFRPTAPYAPGVTGTALPMADRELLLDPASRESTPGADDLFHAIAAGVASNVFSVELDYAVKNQRVMVIYLNRLLCPRFGLPLGRGGFRERRLEVMASWMTGERRGSDQPLEIREAEQLTL